MNNLAKAAIFAILLLFVSTAVIAQPPTPTGPGGEIEETKPTPADEFKAKYPNILPSR